MGRQIEEIISSLGPLTGGTASINMNLADVEALLVTLQADVADGVSLNDGSALNGQLGIASEQGGAQPLYGVQIGYFSTDDGEFNQVTDVNSLPVKMSHPTTGGTGPKDFTSTSYGTISIADANRLGCTIFNSGPGNLHVLLGTATASTTAFTVRLSSGDYYEVPFNYTGLIGGIFATAGTAEVTTLS